MEQSKIIDTLEAHQCHQKKRPSVWGLELALDMTSIIPSKETTVHETTIHLALDMTSLMPSKDALLGNVRHNYIYM